jgi:ABC-2 type transport system permease protein
MNRFPTLLKRELWENRGGIVRAPFFTAAFALLLFVIALMVAEGWFGQISGNINDDGGRHSTVKFGIDLGTLMNAVPDDKLDEIGRGFDIGLLGLASLIKLILTIVIFFYCIGALYDERRDRSVLFWKSMPVSDTMTVLSKLATAALVAPIIAFVATIALHVAFLGVAALVTALHGGSATRLVFGPAEPLLLWAKLGVYLFGNAIWMLPTIGWLLFASSYARSKAFLWAIFPPVLLGIAWNISEMYRAFSMPQSWIWTHVVSRALPFVMVNDLSKGGSFSLFGMRFGNNGPILEWSDVFAIFTSIETWVGAAVGAGLIAASIWLRRNRELAD